LDAGGDIGANAVYCVVFIVYCVYCVVLYILMNHVLYDAENKPDAAAHKKVPNML